MTPYLGVFSALQLPAPWWPRTTLVVALLPLLSLVAGDGFPGWFFLMVWPIIIAMVLLRVFAEGGRRADRTARRSRWSPSASGWPATCTTSSATR